VQAPSLLAAPVLLDGGQPAHYLAALAVLDGAPPAHHFAAPALLDGAAPAHHLGAPALLDAPPPARIGRIIVGCAAILLFTKLRDLLAYAGAQQEERGA
jgi:hypothetical protein